MMNVMRLQRACSTVTTSVPLDLIKSLRARTGAPIIECKQALMAASLDLEEAQRQLRLSGVTNASKYESRATNQGVIVVAHDLTGGVGVMVELTCETDFVAQNERFLSLADQAASVALAESTSDVERIRSHCQESFNDVQVALRENIVFRRAIQLQVASKQGAILAAYVHNRAVNRSHIGQLAVLVATSGPSATTALADQVAMHIAASAPSCINQDDLPADLVAKERAILEEQVAELNKPAKLAAAIVEGRLAKWRAERTLLDQPYALGDGSQTVRQLLGSGVVVDGFVRMRIGE